MHFAGAGGMTKSRNVPDFTVCVVERHRKVSLFTQVIIKNVKSIFCNIGRFSHDMLVAIGFFVNLNT